ncbi:hypothetical protein K431DRAFT_234759 [Polychaeton citri CBS 116435]|uniref:Uncharacterized protein n=1 Tax=Polychaeton citri CBS 116435 TaxID=1314669 RepID=A0A9P4Q256_9PEZI|nr:hypothetical protein K431DRAFT_234759 [Polychaeton citri CBS 116435]
MVQPFCTGKTSSLSGNTTMTVHGQTIKVCLTWEGMQYGKDMKTPLGKMKWRIGSKSWGNTQELWDTQGTKLATYKALCSKNQDSKLEILVPGDEFFLDIILASWVSMVRSDAKESEQLETVLEVVSGIAGS